MIDAKKLNNTIDELGKEIKDLKSVTEVYKELNKLKDEIQLEKESYKLVVKEIQGASDTLKNNSINNLDTTDEFEDMMTSVRKSFQEDMNSIKTDNHKFNKTVTDQFKNLNNEYLEKVDKSVSGIYSELNRLKDEIKLEKENYSQITEEINDISKTLKEISTNNLNTLDELEKMQASHLERNKSDISVEIRQGNLEVQRALGNYIDSKFIDLEKDIGEKYKQDEAKMDRQYKLIIGLLGLSSAAVVISLISLIR